MSRIKQTFTELKQAGRKALVPFITAGDPDLETTVAIVRVLERAGADLIELGIPFSDPMADGPTIQASSERSLRQGTTLVGVLDVVRQIRRESDVPLVLMGYYNPVLRYGNELFAKDAAAAGVDGLLIVDLPPEEADELQRYLRPAAIDLITLLAPTTPPERKARLASSAEGYIYYVSMTGVTGTQAVNADSIEAEVRELMVTSPVPVAVGFGIATPADASNIARFADAVVVGSALVKVIESAPEAVRLRQVESFVRSLRDAIDHRPE
ncbi:MAG TPA: tryptophan synthase subunit alpha [Geothermobacteraceae bacterium]|nr:tryptophan synthase subunit alpha [Geothermobacteraceae bacterium]